MMNGKVTVKTPFSWTFFDPIQSKQNVEKRGEIYVGYTRNVYVPKQ